MKISDTDKPIIATRISNLYETYDDGREDHKNDMETLQKIVFDAPSPELKFGDKVVLPTIYKLHDTLSSYIAETVFSSNDTLFDVVGEDEESQQKAQTHKYDLINSLNKMDFKNVMINESLPNFCLSGEFILFVGHKEDKVYKRKFGIENLINSEDEELDPEEQLYTQVEEQVIYDSVGITAIPSQDFVRDKERGFSIIRKWMTYSEVKNTFKLSDEDDEYFKNKAFGKTADSDELQNDNSYDDDEDKSGLLEVLEYWGNYQDLIAEKEYDLQNYVLTSVAGRLVRCEENPYFNDPIVFYAPIVDPNTKRGISPLRVAIIPNNINSNIVNTLLDLLALQQNKPKYVIEGGLKSNETKEIIPGQTIELTPKGAESPPVEMDFQAGLNASINALPLLEGEIQSATGLYDNMTGAMTETKRTATELNLAASGGSLRINNLTDKIVQGVILECIKRIALYKANMETEAKKIMVLEDGKPNFVDVTPDVHHGNYRYTYVDRKTAQQREVGLKDFVEGAKMFLEADPTLVKLPELFKYWASQKNVNDVNKFIEQDNLDMAFAQLTKQYNMQPQDKKIVRDKLAEIIPQILEGMANGQGNAGLASQVVQQGGMAGGVALPQGAGL